MLNYVRINIKYLYVIHLVLLLFGYQFFATATSFNDGIIVEISRWGYRALVSFLSLIFIYLNLKETFRYDFNTRIGIISFFIFWTLILFRVSYDILIQSFPKDLIPDLFLSMFGFTILYLFSLWRNIDYLDINNFAKISFWLLLFVVLITPVSQALNPNVYIEGSMRASTERLNPISYGRSCLFLLFIAIYLRQINFFKMLSFSFVAIICFTGLFVSGSRGALVVSAFMALVFLFQQIKHISPARLLEISILLLVASSFVLYITTVFFGNYDFIQSILTAGTEVDDSSSIRLLMYEGAWNQFSNSPFLGDYMLERVTMDYPHNILLETLMSLGILGLCFLITIIITIMLKLNTLIIQTLMHKNEVYLMFNLLLISFIGFQFSGTIFYAFELWALIVIFFSIRPKII